jgi:hypothetical protein
MMSYSEFMLCNLLRDMNDSFNNLEYDLMFGEALRIYVEFYVSDYNNPNKGEYDCVYNFLVNSKYIDFKF